jgi:protein involved in polysaccharide export with SLBB domain
LGRVKKPGRVAIPATRDLTVSMAVQQAGGFDTSAKDTAIRITRSVGGKTGSREVNLRAVGAQGRVAEDLMLLPGDVVFVPELMF